MFENWSTIKKLIWLKFTVLAAKVKEILYTVSGSSPLSFDQAVAKPMEHLITNIKPVQNLNGYDAPWPGGGGTNKLPIKEEYIVLYKYINNNGEVLGNNNNFYVNYYIPVTSSTEYNITITTPISYCSIMEYDENKTFIARNLFNCTGSTEFVTETQVFTTRSNTKYVLFGANLDSTKVSLEKVLSYKYQLQTGNFTGFTPYENICPIQGWKTITAWDDAKYGGNIEWNQLINSNTENWTAEAATKNFQFNVQFHYGHMYYIHEEANVTTADVQFSYTSVGFWNSNMSKYTRIDTLQQRTNNQYSGIVQFNLPQGTAESDFVKFAFQYITPNGNADNMQYRHFQLVDLTEVFGSGNEPATVEEFRSLFPLDYYSYNAGEHTCVGAVNGEPYRKVPVTFGAVGKNLLFCDASKELRVNGNPARTYQNNGLTIKATSVAAFYVILSVLEITEDIVGNTYTLSSLPNTATIGIFDSSNNNFDALSSSAKTRTIVSEDVGKYIAVRFYNDTGADVTWADCQVELGSTASTFEPYTDTIYGGMLDLVTGDGTINMASADLGTLEWGANNAEARIYQCNPPNIKRVVDPPYENRQRGVICSAYTYSKNISISQYMDDKAWLRTSNQFFIRDTTYADATAFKTAMNGVQLVYELADPIHFHVDGVSVTPLEGKNNVWTDCGDTLSVTYFSSDVSSAVGYAKTDEATAV